MGIDVDSYCFFLILMLKTSQPNTTLKGFVTKRDMQRMRKEFPLEPEQLESVFDTLDDDHNGYLTLEEFTEG